MRRWGPVPILMTLVFGPLALTAGSVFLLSMVPITQLPAGYIGALLTAIVLCAIVGWKTPRYTQNGLDDLAIAKGLKLYIKTAEEPRYQALYPPNQRVAHFESLLPVALALGVGKTWANTFARYLESTGAMSEVFEKADWENVNHFCRGCHSAASAKPDRSSTSSSGSGYSGSGSSGRGSSGGDPAGVAAAAGKKRPDNRYPANKPAPQRCREKITSRRSLYRWHASRRRRIQSPSDRPSHPTTAAPSPFPQSSLSAGGDFSRIG